MPPTTTPPGDAERADVPPASSGSSPGSDVDAGDAGGRKGITIGRVAAVTVILAFVIMWIYVFANQGKVHPAAWLEDRRFPTAAEPICAAARADIDALPKAFTAKSAAERADVVETATNRLVEMQDELRKAVPAGGEREAFIHQWVEDWSIYIRDRYDYAEALREDEHAEFLVTRKYGTQLSKSMDNFAQVNKMPSCQTPDDV